MDRRLRIILAAVLALGSAGLTFFILQRPSGNQIAVFAASEEIQPCKPLSAANVKQVMVDAGSAKAMKALTNAKELVGKTVFRSVRIDEVFLEGDTTIGKGPSADGQPPTGQRYVSLRSLPFQPKPCAYLDLYTKARQGDKESSNFPLLTHPVQVISVTNGVVVVVPEGEVARVLTAEAEGSVFAVVAPPGKETSS